MNFILVNYIYLKTKISKKMIIDTICKYEHLPILKTAKLRFSFMYETFYKKPSISLNIFETIVVNPSWLILLLKENENYENYFLCSIGHELGHISKDFPTLKYIFKKNCKKCINWTNEVQHDFYSAKIINDCNRKNLVLWIKNKIILKPNNQSSSSHPSWAKRLYYAEHFDFNEELIKQIAADVNCNDQNLIYELNLFYDNIILK